MNISCKAIAIFVFNVISPQKFRLHSFVTESRHVVPLCFRLCSHLVPEH